MKKIVFMGMAIAVLLFGGKYVFGAMEKVKAEDREMLELTKEKAENVAQHLMGADYKILRSFEVKKDGKDAYIVELRFDNEQMTYAYTEYVIVVETGNADRPVRRSEISEEEIEKLKKIGNL